MPRYYYGTVPALAWILNHYFYGGVHYSWLAGEFYPFRTNPKSSNPYLVYGDLYAAWSWRDEYDRFVSSLRISLQDGVDAREDAGAVDPSLGDRLRAVCETVVVDFFYPVVYRVDMERIAPERREVAGSGRTGSREYLIRDLGESEFDLLFGDNVADRDFARLVIDERSGASRASPGAVLRTLERRVAA